MRAWWIEADGPVRPYRPSDRFRLFKWVVFGRDGATQLVAMPRDGGWTYHAEALAALARREGWCGEAGALAFLKREDREFPEADLAVFGGGTLLEDGSVRNLSFRFGALPPGLDAEARAALGLTA